ncbi:MAG: hypothetical protein MJY54_00745 [archaeon]|nr:hypothetical protein [archaeon]
MDIDKIIENAHSGREVTKKDCVDMLYLEDTSEETLKIRAAATNIVRKRNGNAGYIFAQIGVSCMPCEGNCKFCSFGKDHSVVGKIKLSDEDIIRKIRELDYGGKLYGLYLMTMHNYDIEHFLHCVRLIKSNLTGPTQIYSNVGDTSYDDFVRMKESGVDGVYHCWRLGEGKDTRLDPEQRKQTIFNALKAGLKVLDALEPIGPEHTPEEMTEHIFFSKKINSFQCGAMGRVNVPGTIFEGKPKVTELTLSKYEAAMTLTFSSMKRMPIMGIHEPNLLGYLSGANMITAESGVNPRDIIPDTENNRGLSITKCREMLKMAGFTKLVLGNDTVINI